MGRQHKTGEHNTTLGGSDFRRGRLKEAAGAVDAVGYGIWMGVSRFCVGLAGVMLLELVTSAEGSQSRCLEIAGDHEICLWQARMSMSLRSVCEGRWCGR